MKLLLHTKIGYLLRGIISRKFLNFGLKIQNSKLKMQKGKYESDI